MTLLADPAPVPPEQPTEQERSRSWLSVGVWVFVAAVAAGAWGVLALSRG